MACYRAAQTRRLIGAAQAEVETIVQKIRDENTIARTAGQYLQLVPMKQHLVDEVRPTILALMGSVIFLLLIACANVANLMLVRASARERELLFGPHSVLVGGS